MRRGVRLDYSVLELGEHVLIGTYLDGDVEDGEVVEVFMTRRKTGFDDRDVYTLYTRHDDGYIQMGFRLMSVDKVIDGIDLRFGHLKTFRLVE